MPIEKESVKDNKSDFMNKIFYSMFSKIRKFQNLDTYDHYTQKEEE